MVAVVCLQWMNDTGVTGEMLSAVMTYALRVIEWNMLATAPLNDASCVGKVVAAWIVTGAWVKSFQMAFLLKSPMTFWPILWISA